MGGEEQTSRDRTLAVSTITARLFERLVRSRLPQMAAALSYRTIFSLIPMLVVGLVVLKAFTTEEDMTTLLEDALDYSGLSQIAVNEDARESDLLGPPLGEGDGGENPDEPSEEEADRPEGGEAEDESEGAGGSEEEGPAETAVDDWIEERVKQIATVKLGAVGIFGVLLLVYAALSMLVEVERAFNQITHAPTGRAWHKRVTQYWTVLTLGALLLLATFYVGQRFTGLVASLAGSKGQFLVGVAGYGVTVAISTLLLLFMYVTMPNTRVQVRPALAGAFLAALLWEAGKWGFTQYIDYSANYARLYGSLALIPLFLLWIYLTWIIVLFGLHVTWAIQTRRAWLHSTSHEEDDGPAIVDPVAILTVAGVVARAFEKGRALDAGDVAGQAGLSEQTAMRMLQALVRAHVVHQIEEEDEEGFTLARPPSAISARELMGVLPGIESRSGNDPAGRARREVDEARRTALGERSLADLLGSGGS